ncbi:MAG: hypothetical protein QM296_06900 [Bacillota bacterium]|nr:hypothetical protein [Bacillota bacterium]
MVLVSLTVLLIWHTLHQTDESEFIVAGVLTLVLGLVTFLFIYRLISPYLSQNKPNGMSALAPSFSPEDINREITALDFQELVGNSGIYLAGNWLALQAPGDEYFVLLPLGMIRFAATKKVLRNDHPDASGESYNDYTLCFFLSNGQRSEHHLPLEYYGKKARPHKVNARALEEKSAALQAIFQHLLGERLLPEAPDEWLFLYQEKRPLLESAFENHRKHRSNKEIFTSFVEFFPLDTMHIEEERYHVLPPFRIIRHAKLASWLILLTGGFLLSRFTALDDLSSTGRILVCLIRSATVLASAAMLGIYSYEIIRTLLARKSARKQESEEAVWLRNAPSWNVRRENSLILKLLNLVFWAWIIYGHLSRLAAG